MAYAIVGSPIGDLLIASTRRGLVRVSFPQETQDDVVEELAVLLSPRVLEVPARLVRSLAALTWQAHVQPTHGGWLDMGMAVPVMDTSRIRTELGWEARKSSGDALLELLRGMRDGDGVDTPPLHRGGSGPLRIREFLTGIGGRNP